MADISVSGLCRMNVCPSLFSIEGIGMNKKRSNAFITRECINALVGAISSKQDYVAAIDEAIASIPRETYKYSCEGDSFKDTLKQRLLRVGGFLVSYVGNTPCSSSVRFSFNYGKTYCENLIEKVVGVADLVIEKDNEVEVILVRSGAPIESYVARTDKNKPANSIIINAAFLGMREMYPDKDIKVSLFYLTSKKDDNKKGVFDAYESKKGNNIVSVDFPLGSDDNLDTALSINRFDKCDTCRQRHNCMLRAIRVEEELIPSENVTESKTYDYTDSQKAVINHMDGPMYVEAVPGAGKTAVLTERCVALTESGVKPENILCVTFTNKAKGELSSRLMKKGVDGVVTETFNSLGYDILRECSSMVGEVKLAEVVDKKALIEKSLADCYDNGIIIKGANYGYLKGGKYCLVDTFFNKVNDIDEYGVEAYVTNRGDKDDTENILKVYEYYRGLLKADNFIDYDEQISKCVDLFEAKPNVLKIYQNKFKYIMVDEFQDVNEAQFKMVKLLAGENANVVCVGDSDQSIYGWRGGDPSFALNFKEYFANAEVVFMVDNYRCTDSIAGTANALIGNNSDRYEKNIVAHKNGMPVWFYNLRDNPSDIGAIVSSILKKFKPGEIAVIGRNNKTLDKFGLRLDPTGNLTSKDYLIEDAVFLSLRDLFSYAFDKADDEALYRLLIRCGADRKILSGIKVGDSTLLDSLECNGLLDEPSVALAYDKVCKALEYLLGADEFYENGVLEGVLRELLHIMFGFDYHPVVKMLSDKADERLIKTKAELSFFMNSLVIYGDNTEVSYRETDERFNLITAHASKGKEFPCVIIYSVDEFEPTPEERRLLYVAMTRAKENLFIIQNMDSENMVSEFKTCCHEAVLRKG